MTPADSGGVAPTLSAAALVEAVPGLQDVAMVDTTSFRQLPGAHLATDDILALAEELARQADSYAGFVVTQGTDTIEETSFILDVLWVHSAPLVVTGAMRHPTLAGADGPANVLAAVTVAASPEARGRGCVVVMNDEIHAARFVQKRHASSTAAFISPLAGPVGALGEGRPRFWTAVGQRPRLTASVAGSARIALVTIHLGDDGTLLRAAAQAGLDGLVVEALGGGHVPPVVADLLADLTARMPVVLASRTGVGQVLTNTYGFPGSERDLLDRQLVGAGILDGPKARVLLELLVRSGATRADIVAAFATQSWSAT
ncbi:MAG: asparaginase [Euzebyales bacterium]|nr:asparaginase [Euzebyales bacterium]